MQINRQNLKWALRFMWILLLVGVAEALVVLFARKPLPWVALIGALVPLLTCVLIILPMMKVEKSVPPSV